MKPFKIVAEKHADTCVADPLGLKGVAVGQGETYEAAIQELGMFQSPDLVIRFIDLCADGLKLAPSLPFQHFFLVIFHGENDRQRLVPLETGNGVLRSRTSVRIAPSFFLKSKAVRVFLCVSSCWCEHTGMIIVTMPRISLNLLWTVPISIQEGTRFERTC